MRNVLGIFATMPVGGAENLWLNVLNKIDRSRYNPVTCCISDKGVVGEKIESLGFEVVALGRMKGKTFDPVAVKGVARIIRERRIDIVHTHMYHAGLYGRLACLAAGAPRPRVVAMFHSLYTSPKLHRMFLNRMLNLFTDRVIAVSEAVRADVIRHEMLAPGLTTVLPVGIDIDRLNIPLSRGEAKERLGLNRDDFVIGNVGRLVEAKGHRHLLEAFSIAAKAADNFRLVIVGPGRLMDELKGRASELGIWRRVHFLGERHDMPELYRAMDIFAMSSLWEGAPLSLIEAMASGIPSVVTSVGGMPELLDSGSCGIIIPPADPRAMADALSDLSRDRKKMAELSARSVDRAFAMYGSEAMTRKLEAIYDGLFDKVDGGRA